LVELVKHLAVISWKGRLKYRNYNSYKIFTNGIASLIHTAIDRIILNNDERFKDFTKGYYSFHVPSTVFMAFMEGFDLFDEECSQQVIESKKSDPNCAGGPLPSSNFII
jgi:hypothetical protein